ncbi:DUF167 domain-containing protein [bacterium]|nr:DUF167 domain-containing protein [bacterium]
MLIKVKAFPNSKNDEVIKKSKDCFEVRVKEEPVGGKANQAIISLLSEYFATEKTNIRLVKGFRRKNKIFEIIDD